MADEKDPKKQNGDDKAEKAAAKPKRSSRKTAQSSEKKPARSRTSAKAKADDKAEAAEKTAAKPRRRAAAKPKAKAKAEPKGTAEETKAADAKAAEPKPKAPARRRDRPAAESTGRRPAPAPPVVMARAKYVRSSARKARLVMDHVRGKSVADARALLRHSPRGIARDLERLLASAVANAENNHDLVGDDLYVKEIYADEGPTLRRFRPRALGRATRIRKRTSHLTVALSTKE
jgi:ribosomal protein L22